MSKRVKEELLLDLDPRQVVVPRSGTFAVYRSPENKKIHTFPVILFGIFDVVEWNKEGQAAGSDGRMIHGLISQLDGLVIAEEVEDLLFIGYWCKDVQPDVKTFLDDHESLADSGNVDDDPEDDDEKAKMDEDEENEEDDEDE